MHLGYQCLSLTTSKHYFSRDVIFDEHVIPFSLHSNSIPTLDCAGILGSSPITIAPSSDFLSPVELTLDPKSPTHTTPITNPVDHTVDPANFCSSSPISNPHLVVGSSFLNTSPSNSPIFKIFLHHHLTYFSPLLLLHLLKI